MFTGLIIELGEITALQKSGNSARLSLTSDIIGSDAVPGDSISVNGVCLTIVEIKSSILTFDVSCETLNSTNLGSLKRGDKVNLEPSLTPNSRLGGHFVTGHVEAVGRILSKKEVSNAIRIEIEAPRNILKMLVPKGSVAIDGISLTVVDLLPDRFSVVIIPHTAKLTTIGLKGHGDTVNIEIDILAKYVARFIDKGSSGSSFTASLKNSGFMQ
ncbi:MAG: riboflavin synthase [Dissulfurispiraceae bacterium]|jgi:riboflavin synthase|nr:riboflavin synthase [Dissulfurispiraceae bacterium]